ncbi:MAG: hypothetical protein IJR58_05940 [Lachnospiraceae bacterium]|nr:hypothetical protein [Lachnospiraceae bacterium]
MMISPDYYVDQHKDKSYEKLLPIRDELIDSIRTFEKQGPAANDVIIAPSPDVRYQMGLKYLGKLCELIAEKYNEKLWE